MVDGVVSEDDAVEVPGVFNGSDEIDKAAKFDRYMMSMPLALALLELPLLLLRLALLLLLPPPPPPLAPPPPMMPEFLELDDPLPIDITDADPPAADDEVLESPMTNLKCVSFGIHPNIVLRVESVR